MGEDRDRVRVRGETKMGKETVQESKPKFVQRVALNNKGLTRRGFLKIGTVAVAGIAAGLVLPDSECLTRYPSSC